MKTTPWSLALVAGATAVFAQAEDDCTDTLYPSASADPVYDPSSSWAAASYSAPAYSSAPADPSSSWAPASYSAPASADPSASWGASAGWSAPAYSGSAPPYPIPTSSTPTDPATAWPAPPVVTNTQTIYETVCPCEDADPTGTWTTTESHSICSEEKTFTWGEWTSYYTSYGTSTITVSYTATADPSGYTTSAAPTGYPVPSYPAGNSSWGGYGTGTVSVSAFPSETSKACSKPTAPPACVPCEGQPGNDQFCGYTIDDDWYSVTPKTCKVITYNWEITNMTVSPDGVERMALLVNGQFPGPAIEASWGDTIIVNLKNGLPKDGRNGTTIHFHGIRQNGTNEYDGVSSITQCPLAPEDSMTYTFVAGSYGSSWWHAHYALQTYEGIFGPMTIDGPLLAGTEYDDDQSIILQDWNHATVDSLYIPSQVVGGPGSGAQTLDTGLINGKNVWEGQGEYWSMTVVSGKKYRLRVVNTAIQSTFKFHIDGHSFQVIAMDFVPIEPYTTSMIGINIGQRYDIIITADQPAANYWIRSDNQQPCGTLRQPNIQAILNYQGVSLANPTTTTQGYAPSCLDEPAASLVPHVQMKVGAVADKTLDETVVIQPNGGNPNFYKWYLSGTTFVAKWDDPTLYSIWDDGEVPTYSGDLAIEVPELGEWVYVIIESPIPVPHPIHLHGHDFFVIAQGLGTYNSSVPLNLNNPPRRDTAVMPVDPVNGGLGGYLVIAYQTSNPGVWLLHCHIGWHNAMGFALQIIENLAGITVDNSCQLQDVCNTWREYSAQYDVFTNVFADSGV